MANLIILSGGFTKDPELRYSKGKGTAFLMGNIGARDKKGESDYFNIIIFGKAAIEVANHCTKGSQITVIGEIKNNNYDGKNGKVYGFRVVVETAHITTVSGEQYLKGDPEGFKALDDDDTPF